MPSARWWRRFYAAERAALDARAVAAMLERAPHVDVPAGGALVFPHVRLASCGHQVAAVARAVVESGCDEVLALGVLHGAREEDAALVKAARSGDGAALAVLRRVHEPGGHAAEEFSLDGFAWMLDAVAGSTGRPAPRVIARYPFLVGERADDLPGLAELRGRDVAIVATADHVHHGAGYGTPPEKRLARDDPRAASFARRSIEAACELLALGNGRGFQRLAKEHGSDFRDVGPVVASLLPSWSARIVDLELAPYADVLACEEPTWVAAALVALEPLGAPPPAPLGRCG